MKNTKIILLLFLTLQKTLSIEIQIQENNSGCYNSAISTFESQTSQIQKEEEEKLQEYDSLFEKDKQEIRSRNANVESFEEFRKSQLEYQPGRYSLQKSYKAQILKKSSDLLVAVNKCEEEGHKATKPNCKEDLDEEFENFNEKLSEERDEYTETYINGSYPNEIYNYLLQVEDYLGHNFDEDFGDFKLKFYKPTLDNIDSLQSVEKQEMQIEIEARKIACTTTYYYGDK